MSESTTRRIAYCRVSTADQNLDMQIQAMVRYGVPRELIFTDKMSGATSKRPGLIRALQLAQIPGTEFVVWKLDRLGRRRKSSRARMGKTANALIALRSGNPERRISMVGGTVIEALRMRDGAGRDVVRLWCVDRMDECAVYADPKSADGVPGVGDRIWWQSGVIYFNGDKSTAKKVGFSFDPRQSN